MKQNATMGKPRGSEPHKPLRYLAGKMGCWKNWKNGTHPFLPLSGLLGSRHPTPNQGDGLVIKSCPLELGFVVVKEAISGPQLVARRAFRP